MGRKHTDTLPGQVSAVTPLGDAIDGSRRPGRRRRPAPGGSGCPECGEPEPGEVHLRQEIVNLADQLSEASKGTWPAIAEMTDQQVKELAGKARRRISQGLEPPRLWRKCLNEDSRRRTRKYRERKAAQQTESDVRRALRAGGLAAARRARGWSMQELARESGVWAEQLTKNELYGGGLGLESIIKVLDALGLSDYALVLARFQRPSRKGDGRTRSGEKQEPARARLEAQARRRRASWRRRKAGQQ
jgi:transcriptional regulator with XRE-family HTH domain